MKTNDRTSRILSAITGEKIDAFWQKLTNETEEREAFFRSETCQRMIQDIAKSDAGFSCEDVSYGHEEVLNRFGWHDLSQATLDQFISTMSDTAFGVEAQLDDPITDNPFEHYVHLKGGLHVFTMHGQGTIFWVEPVSENPDLYEKLKAAATAQSDTQAHA